MSLQDTVSGFFPNHWVPLRLRMKEESSPKNHISALYEPTLMSRGEVIISKNRLSRWKTHQDKLCNTR